MATAAQIKAARALLKWKQSDLAAASGLSLPSINNIEREAGSPRSGTVQKIRHALELCGIDFISDTGVQLRKEPFEILQYEGPDFIKRQNDDLFACMQGPEDECLVCSLNERMYPKYAADQVMRYHDHEVQTGFKHRILIEEGDAFLLTDPTCYRWLPKPLMGKVPYLIYKNRFVLLLWESRRAVIVKNQTIADTFRIQFDYLWHMGKKIPKGMPSKLDDPAYVKNLRKKGN